MAANPPPGRHTLTPRIVVEDPAGLTDFLRRVFHAEGDYHPSRPTELRIGDSWLMVSDGGGVREPMPAFLYVYAADVDAAYARALGAGATSLEEPALQPYGDRRATVRDPWGNLWQIATPPR